MTMIEKQRAIDAGDAIADDKMAIETGVEIIHVKENIERLDLTKDPDFKKIVNNVPAMMDKHVAEKRAQYEKEFTDNLDPHQIEASAIMKSIEDAAEEYKKKLIQSEKKQK